MQAKEVSKPVLAPPAEVVSPVPLGQVEVQEEAPLTEPVLEGQVVHKSEF